jgi:hypothetical protein
MVLAETLRMVANSSAVSSSSVAGMETPRCQITKPRSARLTDSKVRKQKRHPAQH